MVSEHRSPRQQRPTLPPIPEGTPSEEYDPDSALDDQIVSPVPRRRRRSSPSLIAGLSHDAHPLPDRPRTSAHQPFPRPPRPASAARPPRAAASPTRPDDEVNGDGVPSGGGAVGSEYAPPQEAVELPVLTPLPWDSGGFAVRETLRLDDTPPLELYATALPLPTTRTIVVCMHGAGHCALTFSVFAEALLPLLSATPARETDSAHSKPPPPPPPPAPCILAYDARAHGLSDGTPSSLSSANLTADALHLLRHLHARAPSASITLVGHSMGGAIATRTAAATAAAVPGCVRGLVVVDVVEGSAMAALPAMREILGRRPRSFPSVPAAIAWATSAGAIRGDRSVRVSVPAQLREVDSDGDGDGRGGGDGGGGGNGGAVAKRPRRVRWRTAVEESEEHWRGWFEGLSGEFLGCAVAKMLVLAGVDRMDRELTIGQMQGKFHTVFVPEAGHSVHEDQPERLAVVVAEFMKRQGLVDGGANLPGALQKQRIPPCC